jgi:hypothetical protein
VETNDQATRPISESTEAVKIKAMLKNVSHEPPGWKISPAVRVFFSHLDRDATSDLLRWCADLVDTQSMDSKQCGIPALGAKSWKIAPESLHHAVLHYVIKSRREFAGRAKLISEGDICDFMRAQIVEELTKTTQSEEQEIAQHEQTRKLIVDRLGELAKAEDLVKTKEEIIANIKMESKAIQQQLEKNISELQRNLERFLPHMRVFKTAFYFAAFFAGSMLADLLLNVRIIQPFWGVLGASIAASFLIMSYLMFRDWQKKFQQ